MDVYLPPVILWDWPSHHYELPLLYLMFLPPSREPSSHKQEKAWALMCHHMIEAANAAPIPSSSTSTTQNELANYNRTTALLQQISQISEGNKMRGKMLGTMTESGNLPCIQARFDSQARNRRGTTSYSGSTLLSILDRAYLLCQVSSRIHPMMSLTTELPTDLPIRTIGNSINSVR